MIDAGFDEDELHHYCGLVLWRLSTKCLNSSSILFLDRCGGEFAINTMNKTMNVLTVALVWSLQ